MNFDDAYKLAVEKGLSIRSGAAQKGWVAKKLNDADDLFWINPITGGNYLATFSDADRARTDWSAS